LQVAVGQEHTEGGVEVQERLKKKLLIPESELVDHPFARVLMREKHVVDVDHDAGLQSR